MSGISASRAQSLIPTAESTTSIADGRSVIELPAHSPPELAITTLVGNGAQILSLNPQHETLEEFFVDQVTRQRDQDEGRRVSA